ncbi:MAG: hypothetical protein HDR56_08555 [Treponema sp.]|nr:hypothetical protein [Treponema sp.]
MKRFFAFLAIIVISLALFSGCRQNDDDAVVERLTTTAVSNMRATAYEGAIVVTWNYNADYAEEYVLTREKENGGG